MKFSQFPFKNIFYRFATLKLYLQIIHVRRKAIFTFFSTCPRALTISHFKMDILQESEPPHQKNR